MSRTPQVESHRIFERPLFAGQAEQSRRMAEILEARQAPRLRFIRVDRQGLVVASARMGNVVDAAPERAAAPAIENVEGERGVDVDGDGSPDLFQKQTRNSFGWYGWGELQPWRRWAFGVRYDSTQFPDAPGYQWAVEPYVTFYPSEFLRFRVGYKHTDRSHPFDDASNGGSARLVEELIFQATCILGAYPAHAV